MRRPALPALFFSLLLLPALALLSSSGPALAAPTPPVRKEVLCRQCGKAILGDSVLVKGNIYYHPAHFTCSRCQGPLADREFFWREEAPWCRGCYEGAVLPKCDICGGVIREIYYNDDWGNRFHPEHEQESPRCSTCGRIVSQKLTQGGGLYDDGRAMCALCRQTAVLDPARARELMAQAAGFLARQGVQVDPAGIPLRLLSLREFEEAGGHPKTAGRTATSLRVSVESGGKRTEERTVEEIQVLYGLPEKEFLFVVVHELTHAWLHQNAKVPIDPNAEEGVSTLASALWARDQDDPLVAHMLRSLEERKDAYGRAYKDARRRLDYLPFRDLLKVLAEKGSAP